MRRNFWVAFKFQNWFWGKWSWYKHVINVCLHGNLIGFLHRRVKWFREKFLGVVFVMIKIFSKCNHESEHAINLNKSVFLLPIELNIVYYHRKYYWWWLPFFLHFAENSTLMNPLQPCCEGINFKSCGSVNDKGEKQYKLCKKPEFSLFWDNVHPSQNGWHAVSMLLQPSLDQLI